MGKAEEGYPVSTLSQTAFPLSLPLPAHTSRLLLLPGTSPRFLCRWTRFFTPPGEVLRSKEIPCQDVGVCYLPTDVILTPRRTYPKMRDDRLIQTLSSRTHAVRPLLTKVRYFCRNLFALPSISCTRVNWMGRKSRLLDSDRDVDLTTHLGDGKGEERTPSPVSLAGSACAGGIPIGTLIQPLEQECYELTGKLPQQRIEQGRECL